MSNDPLKKGIFFYSALLCGLYFAHLYNFSLSTLQFKAIFLNTGISMDVISCHVLQDGALKLAHIFTLPTWYELTMRSGWGSFAEYPVPLICFYIPLDAHFALQISPCATHAALTDCPPFVPQCKGADVVPTKESCNQGLFPKAESPPSPWREEGVRPTCWEPASALFFQSMDLLYLSTFFW